MRNAFADELVHLAQQDERIVLLSGDIGNHLFDRFKQLCPNRFFNCGVAEANMASVAAGMAMCGLRPITYTIAPFNTTRCLEQIRNDICYHNVPVLIVGTGSGLSYASLGCTHHSCEDISFLRSLPNMTVFAPADSMELRSLLRLSMQLSGPAYMRIGKTGEPLIHATPPQLVIGKALIIKPGKQVCCLSTGNMLPSAMQTAQLLLNYGIDAQIVGFPTVKPLDTILLHDLFHQFSLLAAMEEHSVIGGFGASIAEWVADTGPFSARLLRFGTPDRFAHPIGSQSYLRAACGLKPEDMAEQIVSQLKGTYSCERLLQSLSKQIASLSTI